MSNEESLTNAFNRYRDICMYAYSVSEEGIKRIAKADSVRHVRDEGMDADAFLIWKNGDLIVHFLGTQRNFIDIIFNFITFPKKLPKGARVHAGYYTKALTLFSKLADECSLVQDKKRIIITGDSQGGGMARSFYYTMVTHDEEFRKARLFTIGTPAMGNRKFNSFIEGDNTYHFLLDKDPIRYLPMCIVGFKHPKNLINLKSNLKGFKFEYHLPENYKFGG